MNRQTTTTINVLYLYIKNTLWISLIMKIMECIHSVKEVDFIASFENMGNSLHVLRRTTFKT